MVVNLSGNEIGYREVKRIEADMRNDLCIFLVTNDVKSGIVDSYRSQYCEGNCGSTQIIIWQSRTCHQGFGYSGYSLAYGGRIFWRKF